MDTIKIKYLDKTMSRLQHKGEWVDLRVRTVDGAGQEQTVDGKTVFFIKAGTTVKIRHGVCMQLPFGKEALTRPRSSLFLKKGLLFATSGVIDSAYCGPNDEWMTVVYATKDVYLEKDERVTQFRTFENMPIVNFVEDDLEGNSNRGGHGSTGRM